MKPCLSIVLLKAKFAQEQLSFRRCFLVRTFTSSKAEPFTLSAYPGRFPSVNKFIDEV